LNLWIPAFAGMTVPFTKRYSCWVWPSWNWGKRRPILWSFRLRCYRTKLNFL